MRSTGRVVCLSELTSRINRHDDDRRENRDNTDNDEDLDEREAACSG